MKPRLITAITVAAIVAGMTGLAFAAVPLYRAFCQVTGFGGTTQRAATAPGVVLERQIEVRFDANVAPGLAIEFAPKQQTQRLRIGEAGLAYYRVRNMTDQAVVARATYNVAPHVSGGYFMKVECFCFNDRVFAPHEEVDLPVIYFIDPEIVNDPDTADLETITLSYTYFRATDQNAAAQASSS